MPAFSAALPSHARRTGLRLGVVSLGIAVASVAVPATTGDASASTLSHDLRKLRQCESGGRWGANTGNGYYGAYQFNLSTWHGLGYGGRPNRAKPKKQTEAAMKLHAHRGWRPWPSCARQEHLN